MRDLNQIIQQNAAAANHEGLNEAHRAGKYVVAQYAGLAFTGFSTHDNERDANAAAIAFTNDTHNPTARTEVLPPITKGLAEEHYGHTPV